MIFLNRINSRTFFCLLFLVIAFNGCKHISLESHEYIRWIENPQNGLVKTKQINDILFIAQLKPIDYYILQNNQFQPIDSDLYINILQDVSGLIYFQYRIHLLNSNINPILSDKLNIPYNKALSYLAFQANQDFSLQIGRQIYPCLLHHFEQSHQLSPNVDITLGFELPPSSNYTDVFKNDLTLIYDDKLFGVGKIKISFNKEVLTNIPSLKLKDYDSKYQNQ